MKDVETGKNIDDIELSLIKGSIKAYCGFDDFEKVFEKKKMIGDAIGEFQGKNKATRQNIALMQQRISQIEHLAERADKQSVLLRNQMNKVNEAHTMAKILTIEKMIRVKQENDELERKRDMIFRIREGRSRKNSLHQSIDKYRTEKLRQLSFLEERHFQDALTEKKNQTLEVKRSRADKVREDKQRLKDRLRRYEVLSLSLSNSKQTRLARTTRTRCCR